MRLAGIHRHARFAEHVFLRRQRRQRYRQDIITAYGQLPARDKRLIYEKYNEEFGKYGIELKMKTTCTGCGNEEVINVDLVENFFRMVYTS